MTPADILSARHSARREGGALQVPCMSSVSAGWASRTLNIGLPSLWMRMLQFGGFVMQLGKATEGEKTMVIHGSCHHGRRLPGARQPAWPSRRRQASPLPPAVATIPLRAAKGRAVTLGSWIWTPGSQPSPYGVSRRFPATAERRAMVVLSWWLPLKGACRGDSPGAMVAPDARVVAAEGLGRWRFRTVTKRKARDWGRS